MNGKELIPKIPKDQMEVVMESFKEIASIFANRDIDINKTNILSDEKINLKILSIVKIVSVLGILSGGVMLVLGKTEIGFPILSSTLTGVFGFLGGKSLAK